MIRLVIIIAGLLLVPSISIAQELQFPLIKGHGGIVVQPNAAEQPRPGSKLVIDLTTGETKDGINTGLDKVARYVNLFAAGGVRRDQVKFTVVVHGAAVPAVLETPNGEANPNRDLIAQLRKAGVEMFVCGQALYHAGHRPEEVSDQITLAQSALSVVVNRQTDGFAYVPLR